MSSQGKRVHPRIRYEVPIRHAPVDTPDYLDGRTGDFSRGGLSIVSPGPFIPKTDIHIVMGNHTPGTYGPEAYKSYVARVCWHRESINGGGSLFQAGVEFMKRLQVDHILPTQSEPVSCHLCGSLFPEEEIRWIEDGCRLCIHCHKHYLSIPAGAVRDCIQRYLTGNVL